MKKALTLILSLALCLSLLSVAAFAAEYSYVSVTGTMNEWNPAAESGKMTETSAGVYSLTFTDMAAGEHQFKFTANGTWSDLDLGGAFMGSGVEGDLYWGGSNIVINVAETCNVTIVLDLTAFDGSNGAKFTVTIGDQVDEPAGKIKVHISVPEDWGDVYAYVWNPEHLGSWSGTKVEGGVVEITAAFEGMVINNGNGRQSWDIKDIDLTKEEVWIIVNADGSYALAYEAPAADEPEPPAPDARPIKLHVIAEHWNAVYAYTYNPELCGSWPGTLVENGVFETLNIFEGLVLNNGEGQQTADIKDIDLTKEEVWITVNADGSYALAYEAPAAGGEVEPVLPSTGDNMVIVFVVMMMAAACVVTLVSHKKYI